MASGQLLCLLLALLFCSSTSTSAVNVTADFTVSSGDSAFLPCPVTFTRSEYMRISVKWEKDGRHLCQYFINSNESVAPKCRSEFKVNTTHLGLQIINVEISDAGSYKCSTTKLIPPPSEDITATLRLKVLSLTLHLLNSTNSSCVQLRCSLQGLHSPQVNYTWTNATQLLRNETSIMNNILALCKPNWTDGETIMCRAYYLKDHTLYKSITLPCNSVGCNRGDSSWLIIAATSTCAGLFLLILLGVAIFKCKQRDAANGAVFYKNKIYENFTISTVAVNSTSDVPQNGQLVTGANIRSTTRSTPNTMTQREECIYEN